MKILLPLEDELGTKIDEARGPIPRVVWIRLAIEEVLAGANPHFPETEQLQPPGTRLKKGVAVGHGAAPTQPPGGQGKFCAHPLNRRDAAGVCGVCTEKVT